MLVVITTHPIQYQVPLWREMEKAGINFEVWYLTDYGTKKSFDVEFGKSFVWDIPLLEGYKYRFLKTNEDSVPNKGFRGISLKEDLKQLFKTHQVSHVYINGWQVLAYWQALWTAKSLKLITIFKGESNDLKPEVAWKWPFKKFLLSHFFNRIDYFLYIGSANKRLYVKHGIPEKKLYPGLYCVDNKRFNEDANRLEDQKDEIRTRWNIGSDKFCILFSGKFIDKKRPLDIIRAIELIPNHQDLIQIMYVGDGELYEDLKLNGNVLYDKGESLITSSEKANISIIGFLNQSEIAMAYVASDCLILPSNYNETWGLVVNEVMACGKPAIVSDQCGSAEDLAFPISPELVFGFGNITALSEAIIFAMKTKFTPSLIAQTIANFSYSSTVNSVKEILAKANSLH